MANTAGAQQATVLYGNIVDPMDGVQEGFVSFAEGKITGRGPGFSPAGVAKSQVIAFADGFICPGFIDLHVHGGGGADFADGKEESFRTVAEFHASGGTTSLLATLVPLERGKLTECVKSLGGFIKKQDGYGACVLGVHLEGPFVNRAWKGALDDRFITEPDEQYFQTLNRMAAGSLRLITLAPEMAGAARVVREAASSGVLVFAGHTEADPMMLKKSMQWGVRGITHFYNAMAGFHHRKPGTVGGGLLLENLHLSIIPEIHHVDPLAFRLAYELKGPELITVITDCISAGGMKDGTYPLGSMEVVVENNTARLLTGALAGSAITMLEGIKYLVEQVGLTVEEAVGMASLNPARLLGLANKKGSLLPGFDADITVFDKKFRPLMTIVGGKIVYSA
ncbi:N-acetylglucosamine-6-phosphate deacetylase [Thermincola potens]|uniref:N-acetylglucosamine-6-phosphate deacetylase n=1 Tax=Thermincola potens (strain JR) TaxID=635013 RepID=D5X9B7_THEPJ|nr:N-acetylglucosamine-6-phosphate deacetylase [Thermincola potens]ADG83021.1 N-acetylglucosamine-6-phosphate deacetylase [Thermincola potens JR]